MSSCLTALFLAACSEGQQAPSRAYFGIDRALAGQSAAAVSADTQARRGLGQVVISFKGLLERQRRLLATLADVDHVTVVLTDATTTQHTQTIAKAAIVNGVSSVTFDGLPLGTCSVRIEAFDALGNVIGVDARGGLTVTAGPALQVAVEIPLNPTLLPTPTPPAGGGGSDTPETGGVDLSIGFLERDAKPLVSTMSEGVEVHGQLGRASAVDPDGNVWTGFGVAYVTRPDGSKKAEYAANPGMTFAFTSDGKAWIDTTLFDASGNQLATFTLPAGKTVSCSACDSAGNLWVSAKTTGSAMGALYKISPAGTKLFETIVHTEAGVHIDDQDNVYLNDFTSVKKLDPNGTQLFAVGTSAWLNFGPDLPSRPFNSTLDPQGNLWVAVSPKPNTLQTNLVKLSPTGTELLCVRLAHPPMMVASDASGNIWVDDDTYLLKYSNAGEPLDIYYNPYVATQSFATNPLNFGGRYTLDPAGYVWGVEPGTGYRIRRFQL